jgi:DNA polymerase II small subunit/DNA polymerase delta subunit B
LRLVLKRPCRTLYKCKANVEENITTGLKIENMCNKIIQMFESRLNVIEQKIDTKCDESKVRDIVKDELANAQDQITSYAEVAASESGKRVDKVEMTTVVVDEIYESDLISCSFFYSVPFQLYFTVYKHFFYLP